MELEFQHVSMDRYVCKHKLSELNTDSENLTKTEV